MNLYSKGDESLQQPLEVASKQIPRSSRRTFSVEKPTSPPSALWAHSGDVGNPNECKEATGGGLRGWQGLCATVGESSQQDDSEMTSPPADASKPFVASHAAVQAVRMLELFASVGATAFDLTHTNLDGEKRGFRGNRSVDEVTRSMPYLVASAVERQNNVIIRPRVQGATCIQLDDLDGPKAAKIAPAAFLVLETSPGNYQAWVAVKDAPTGTTTRLRKGAGADLNASGATRVAGTHNFKPKYAPAFPVVRMADARPGLIVTVADLEALHVLAPEEVAAPVMVRPGAGTWSNRQAARSWPSYAKCLENAPAGPSGNPSRTSVDFVCCKIAASWGHSVEATAAQLMQESTKAAENGTEYATKTAQRAAWAAAQRNRQQMKP